MYFTGVLIMMSPKSMPPQLTNDKLLTLVEIAETPGRTIEDLYRKMAPKMTESEFRGLIKELERGHFIHHDNLEWLIPMNTGHDALWRANMHPNQKLGYKLKTGREGRSKFVYRPTGVKLDILERIYNNRGISQEELSIQMGISEAEVDAHLWTLGFCSLIVTGEKYQIGFLGRKVLIEAKRYSNKNKGRERKLIISFPL